MVADQSGAPVAPDAGHNRRMSNVHQCPACELKFRNRTELDYHWAEDHAPPVEVDPRPAPEGIPEDPRP